MGRLFFAILGVGLLNAAPVFAAGHVIGSRSFEITGHETADIMVSGDGTAASVVAATLDCRAQVEGVALVDTHGQVQQLASQGTFFVTPGNRQAAFSQVRVTVRSQLILGGRTQSCNLSLSTDLIPPGPEPVPGQINYVTISGQNSQQIATCLGNALQAALQARGDNDLVQTASGPDFASQDGRTIYFLVGTTTTNYGIALDAIGVNNYWRYSSMGGSVGPIGVQQWEYDTNAMSSVAHLVMVSGSVVAPNTSPSLMDFSIGSCWGR